LNTIRAAADDLADFAAGSSFSVTGPHARVDAEDRDAQALSAFARSGGVRMLGAAVLGQAVASRERQPELVEQALRHSLRHRRAGR